MPKIQTLAGGGQIPIMKQAEIMLHIILSKLATSRGSFAWFSLIIPGITLCQLHAFVNLLGKVIFGGILIEVTISSPNSHGPSRFTFYPRSARL